MAHCAAKNEVWVCDEKGFVHILDAMTLAPIAESEGLGLKTVYGHQAMCMAASNDNGSLIAVGDAKGYITVFDSATRTQKFYTALHKNKVMGMEFNSDNS